MDGKENRSDGKGGISRNVFSGGFQIREKDDERERATIEIISNDRSQSECTMTRKTRQYCNSTHISGHIFEITEHVGPPTSVERERRMSGQDE